MIAERAISRHAEHKYIGFSNMNVAILNGANGGLLINLMPNPQQGVNKHERVGCEIRPDSGIMKGFVNFRMPAPGNATPTSQLMVPTYLKMWIIDLKSNVNDASNGALPALEDFLMDPEGQVVPLAPSMQALLFDTNATKYRVKATKLIKLSAQVQDWHPNRLDTAQVGNVPGVPVPPFNTAYVGAQALGGSGEFSKSFYFDFGKHLKKTLSYTPNGNPAPVPNLGVYPENQALWCIMQPIFADNSNYGGNTLSLQTHYTVQNKYTDA